MCISVFIDSVQLHIVLSEVPAAVTVTPFELLPHFLTKPSVTVRQTRRFWFFFLRQQRASKNQQT